MSPERVTGWLLVPRGSYSPRHDPAALHPSGTLGRGAVGEAAPVTRCPFSSCRGPALPGQPQTSLRDCVLAGWDSGELWVLLGGGKSLMLPRLPQPHFSTLGSGV